MKTISIITLLLIGITGCAQSNDEDIISKFVEELKNNEITNQAIIDKYFTFSESISAEAINNEVIPLLSEQFRLLRERVSSDCSKISIIKHDAGNKAITDYKLKSPDLSVTYYVFCDDLIVTPVLMRNSKIISITTHSKVKTGTKGFIVY